MQQGEFGVDPRNPLDYTGPGVSLIPITNNPRDPLPTDRYSIFSMWRNKNSSPVRLWVLVGYSNGNADWRLLAAGGMGNLNTLSDDANTLVNPDGTGNIQLEGTTGQITVTADAPNNKLVFALAGGGTAVDQINVDASTPPGTDPVVASVAGQITITGAQVASGVVGTNVIRTDSLAVNTFTIEVQRTTTAATSTVASNGVGHFFNKQFTVDSSGFVELIGTPMGSYANLGIAYNGGTGVFSITGDDGSALSATNPAVITIWSKATPGTMKTFLITTPYSFIDDAGASQIIGNRFGLTTGIATDQDIPFFLYFVMNDAETDLTPMISRSYLRSFSPAAALIGKPSSAIANDNISFWALDDSITVAQYDVNPVVYVGLFRMRMSALDDWTVQTLNYSVGNVDGVGATAENRIWSMPTSQFGAATGRLMTDNGGTTPQWTTQEILYQYSRGSICTVRYDFRGDGGTDGAGAVNMQMVLPFRAVAFNADPAANVYSSSWYGLGSGMTARTGIHEVSRPANLCEFIDYAGTPATNNLFGNGARQMSGLLIYRI